MVMSVSDEKPDFSTIEQAQPTVAHLFVDRVGKTPQGEAFRFPQGDGWSSMTWKQADERVRNIAAGLISLGVEAQDRVALASATRVEWALADLGVMLAGAATTTIYPTSTVDDTLYIISDSGAKVVFTEDDTHTAMIREGRDAVPSVTHIVTFDGRADGDDVMTLVDLELRGAEYLEAHADAVDERVAGVQKEHLATLIYTSGTTGRPKGVRLPHDSWVYEVSAVDAIGLLGEDDVQYLWLPLAHVFGKLLLTLPLQIGFPTAIDGRVDKIVENLPTVRPTWMGAAPRIFEKVYGRITTMMRDEGGLKAKLFDWHAGNARKVSSARTGGDSVGGGLGIQHKVGDALVAKKIRARFGGNIRFFISGSAALNKDIATWFDGMGIPILEGYGLTETSAACAVNRPYANQPGTVGWPLPGTQITLGDDGEILVKGRGVMQGYRGLETETAESLVDGWFHTGDIGEITPTGHVRITDRKKDLFKTSNGKYVAPSQIEAMFKGICPFASQLVVEGDGRKFVSALVTLDEEAITEWAGKQSSLQGADYRTIVTSDEARDLVQGYVDQLNSGLARHEQIKRFLILPRDLTVEDGEVTPSLKLKRKVVAQKFKDDLDGLYQD
ncbi:long-chain fatty acid--CoA ligase [Calidifontibacter sp. DB0510]|uniref:Long-chain fatty acid--CoA ligase n=1 Tax=Metallococcus carri TaxID=1656884 RepID=A0A967AXJ6_9MICO|nr:long-chain fatty acid--CoA ligase [Metallococcus carri]NHN54264.1 long-chain fatty acid--CoA ligase [Metallococcus carri]NOP36896.1 long-chain fatty acid--CoA ligase [Calidifontibacter sp. DB2511S]